jgi:hypothetical protein
MGWITLDRDRVQWRAPVNTVMVMWAEAEEELVLFRSV